MKLRVGLDVDGVIFDFVSAFREQAQNLLGRKFPKFSSDWEFGNWNLNPAEWDKLWGSVRESHNWFYYNEKPINKKTVEYVKRLDAISELCYITNRMPTRGASVLRQTQEQLDLIYLGEYTNVMEKGVLFSADQMHLDCKAFFDFADGGKLPADGQVLEIGCFDGYHGCIFFIFNLNNNLLRCSVNC